jgi:hypothetical protein
MTRDAAAQAVHERLEHEVSSMPAFDVEAGWAALAAQLEGPVAPVIPLRPRRPRRVVTLAVAAAIFVGGSALAMARHAASPEQALAPVASGATSSSRGPVIRPHGHPTFSGAPPVAKPSRPKPDTHGEGTQHAPSSPPPPSNSTGGGASHSDSGHHGGPKHVDSPDDTDHGTGNDGQHDDNGKGNDAQGQDPGHSGGNQGSSDRGSDSSHGANGKGNGNGHGNGP